MKGWYRQAISMQSRTTLHSAAACSYLNHSYQDSRRKWSWPSTYAPTIEPFKTHYYVKLVSKRLSRQNGEIVNSLIEFSGIINVKFTAEIDETGRCRSQGDNGYWWVYRPFEGVIKLSHNGKIQTKDEPAGFDYPRFCGSPMVIKLGRFGKFYACN